MILDINRFLRPLKDNDRIIRIYGNDNKVKYSINSFSVSRSFIDNDSVCIVKNSGKKIYLDFKSTNDAIIALNELQLRFDTIKNREPVNVTPETEQYVEHVTGGILDYADIYEDLKNNVSATYSFEPDSINARIISLLEALVADYNNRPSLRIYNETPIGEIDGVNKDYELSETPLMGTLQVYLNGLLQTEGLDYTLNDKTISFTLEPLSGWIIKCSYDKN
jgi:hypothetical protein